MWSYITELFKAMLGSKHREYQRADFAAVSEQWENLVEKLTVQLEAALKRLELTLDRITDLEGKLSIVQREAEKCLQERLNDGRRIVELELQVAGVLKRLHGVDIQMVTDRALLEDKQDKPHS